MPLPDFIGIGAQKCGTTWLDKNLRSHPQVWMPPIKELHYFDHRMSDPPALAGALRSRLLGNNYSDGQWRRIAAWRLKRQRKNFSLREFAWDLNYFLRPPSAAHYASLFRPKSGQVAGEITPSYALLTEEQVAYLRALLPDTKVIFMIRNPIERAWSEAAMVTRLFLGRNANEATEEEIFASLERDNYRKRSDYLETLDRWSHLYPPERIFVGFLEDIHFRPRRLFKSVCSFLEMSVPANFRLRQSKIHRSGAAAIPGNIARRLASEHLEEIREMAEVFGEYAAFWLWCSERILNSSPEVAPYPFHESPWWDKWVKEVGSEKELRSGTLSRYIR